MKDFIGLTKKFKKVKNDGVKINLNLFNIHISMIFVQLLRVFPKTEVGF